ncbi:MAG: hypothetical protein QM651_13755 [Rhodoblastus sp.]
MNDTVDQGIAADIEKNLTDVGAAPQPQGVKAKLAAAKAAKTGEETFPLPVSGVVVSLPRFKPYFAWTKAQRLGDGDSGKTQVYYILELATFDGEKLTFGDYRELIDAADHLQIIGKVFGGASDAKDDDAGN